MLCSASLRLGQIVAIVSCTSVAFAADAPKVERLSQPGTPAHKVTIGEAEYIGVPLTGAVFKARIDTGATTAGHHPRVARGAVLRHIERVGRN